MRHTDFSKTITIYFIEHLTVSRNLSSNTIDSYRDTFKLLLLFMQSKHTISPEKLDFEMLQSSTVVQFLEWLELSRNSSISTRNQRLAAIQAFFRYVQYRRPDIMLQCQQILEIPKKKHSQILVSYLSDHQLELLFKQPNPNTVSGKRNLTLMTFLYDSGARVQELIDLNVRDIRLENPSRVILTGKGRKSRQVPLMSATVKRLEQYIVQNDLSSAQRLDTPLFFNSRHERLTRAGVTYILKKYAQQTGGVLHPDDISPHILRHTKAMHLLRSDINLVYIRDFLGHVDITTTEIYARADEEMKRKAFVNVVPNYSIQETMPWQTDTDLLQWLNCFGKKNF